MVSIQQPADMGENPIPGFMESNIERDCSKLGGLFQVLINDLKTSVPHWEDFQAKATKLHTQLRATVLSLTAFLESFQRLADVATGSRGATKELGASLTRLCLRHKAIEYKMKSLSSSLLDYLVMPLQDRIEDWKRVTVQLDKDHAKEYKKARQEIKKKSSDTLRLQKKARKGKTSVQYQLDSAMQEVGDMFILLEETEKNAVRRALIEERGRFIYLVNAMTPTIEDELSMLGEMVHLQSVLDELGEQVKEPHGLPPSSEQVILDIKGQETQLTYTPPGSPTLSSGSRKSSVCGSIGSMNSTDSRSSSSLTSGNSGHSAHSHPSTGGGGQGVGGAHHRNRSLSTPLNPAHRLSSVSSQDSGFTSQDTLFMRPGTPTGPAANHVTATPGAPQNNDYARQQSSGSVSSGDSTPSSSPSQQYAQMGPTPGTPASAKPPAIATLGRRSNRPKPVPAPTIPVRVPHENLPDLPAKKSGHNFDRPQIDQVVPKPKTPQENVENDWTKRSCTLPNRRSHSIASPYGIGGTIPRNHRPIPATDLNGSHDSGYDESGQLLPPPTGFDTQEFTIEENPYLIPENDSISSGSSSMSQSSSHSSINMGQHPPTPLQQQVPSRSGASTPTHHRHSSLGALYDTPKGENTYQNMTQSKAKDGPPPPPIRRTPSAEQVDGTNHQPTANWENPTYGMSQFDESGQFKVPQPILESTPQTTQGVYDYPTRRQRPPPTMTRSKSVASPKDLAPHQQMARLSLMENLNAKLAQRNTVMIQQPLGTPHRNPADHVDRGVERTPAGSVGMDPQPPLYPVGNQQNQRTPGPMQQDQRTPGPVQEAVYDIPRQVHPQSHVDMIEDLPPPPDDFMGAPPPPPIDQGSPEEHESGLQAALKENKRKLKRTETMDRSAPRISQNM